MPQEFLDVGLYKAVSVGMCIVWIHVVLALTNLVH